MLASAYTAFDKAGRTLGIDAAELAERIDLAALIPMNTTNYTPSIGDHVIATQDDGHEYLGRVVAVRDTDPDGRLYTVRDEDDECFDHTREQLAPDDTHHGLPIIRTIELPVYGITVELSGSPITGAKPLGGTISCTLKSQPAGYEGDAEQVARYDAAVDGLEALILAHAIGGIDIAAPAYVDGIVTAVDAISNALGE